MTLREKINKSVSDFKHEAGNIAEFFKLVNKLDKRIWWLIAAFVAVNAANPFVTVMIPKLILEELLGAQRVWFFVGLVVGAAAVDSVLSLLQGKLETLMQGKCLEIQEKFATYLSVYITKMDYERLEDPKELDDKERVVLPFLQGGVWGTVGSFTQVLSSILTLIGLAAIIMTLDFGILLFMLAAVLINKKLYKKVQTIENDIQQKENVLSREISYCENLSADFAAGKDVRLYNMRPIIMDKIDNTISRITDYLNEWSGKNAVISGIIRMITELQIVVVYAYMTYKVLFKNLSIANFTLYASAASRFSAALTRFFDNVVWVRMMAIRLEPFMRFVRKEPENENGKEIGDLKDCTIEFKNVSFKYPRTDRVILDNVSITIKPGEKLSVVGLNGAGKTTFIKLLSRLYKPDSGEITVGGVNINDFEYSEYVKLLGVVFQDFKVLAFTVKENIALDKADSDEDIDEEILDAVTRAGLKDKIESLPDGIHTTIYKSFDENGTELSGGQNQKLAIARAIYKDSPIVILDEPTAALDPVSEFEIYSRFNELIGNKTAIYISHRLSSCRFCDRIAVFQNGTIAELGCHEELMRNNETYAKMYEAQSKYYV